MLTSDERIEIRAYAQTGMSGRAIAATIGRSKDVVCRFLRDPQEYERKKHQGRQAKMSAAAHRRLLREASHGEKSARKLRDDLQLSVGVKRVQQLLKDTSHLSFEKRAASPWMTKRHAEARVDWAGARLSSHTQWENIVFTDEKKWNLDGPDGCQFYWRDTRQPPKTTMKRQSGGGSVMVWGGFSATGKTPLVFLEGRQDSVAYTRTLASALLPTASAIAGEDWQLQQDNASIHMSAITRAFFNQHSVRVLPWPARSPDLNPIENVWGLMVQRVYANGKSFSTRDELKVAISNAWENLSLSYFNTLVMSMNKRCVAVLNGKGRVTAY